VDCFPYAENRTYTPASKAPKEKLFALHEKIRIERCVLVPAGCQGFHNSVIADAIAAKGAAYLGIALLPVETKVKELRRHYDLGFRGVRFNYMSYLGKGAAIEDVIAMTPHLADAGMHLQIHFENKLIREIAPAPKRSAAPVVIDHMGRVDASTGLEQPGFIELRRLLESDQV
jgi:2-pyrone-4,6-dicarboxylate lactonase